MKVLIISGAFPPMRAGDAEHALHLCTQLACRGMDVHLLTTKGQSAPGSVSFHVHAEMKGWSWSDAPTLITILRKIQPDLVLLIYSAWIYQSHPMITFAPTIVKRVLGKAYFITQLETIIDVDRPEDRLQSLMIAVEPKVPDPGGWQQIDDWLDHSQAGAENGDQPNPHADLGPLHGGQRGFNWPGDQR